MLLVLLELDDPVAVPVVPARPGLTAVLVQGKGCVVPVVEVGVALVGLVLQQVGGGLGARGAGAAQAQELAADPGLGGHRGRDPLPGLIAGQALVLAGRHAIEPEHRCPD